MTLLETERLFLRTPEQSDILPLTRLWCDADVTRYMGGPRDFEHIQSLLEEEVATGRIEQYDLWPLVERASGGVVGHCGLLKKEVDGEKEIEICYVIDAPFWRRGYATEIAAGLLAYASATLGQRRLIALIDPENVGSEIVARKVGMRHERDTVRPSGKTMRIYAWSAAIGGTVSV